MQSDGALGGKGASMLVCGDKEAWNQCKDVVKSVAPAAFFAGQLPEQANAIGIAICTFMTSVFMVRPAPFPAHALYFT